MIDARWRARLAFAAKAFLNAAFVGALVSGALHLTEKSIRAPEHQVDLGVWTVLVRPEWASLDDVSRIRREAGLAGRSASLVDREELSFVRMRLETSPSVRRVVTLRRVSPNRLVADLELRAPAAAVELPGGEPFYVPVDADGVALSAPSPARPSRSGAPLRLITGVAAGAPEPGLRFGPDVSAAARLADRLDGVSCRGWTAFLDRVDVANHGGRSDPRLSEIVLASSGGEGGCRVEWGRLGAEAEQTGEPAFESKAGRLRRALDLFPGLVGLRSVSVAFRELVVVPTSREVDPDFGSHRRGSPGARRGSPWTGRTEGGAERSGR